MASERYDIPAPVVWSVITGLILSAIGGAGGGLYSAMRINNALDKIDELPSADLMTERRQYRLEKESNQDNRITRLERAVWGRTRNFGGSDAGCRPDGWRGVPSPLPVRVASGHDAYGSGELLLAYLREG